MARTLQVIVRLNPREKQKLKDYAESMGVSMSEVIQDYIKALPSNR